MTNYRRGNSCLECNSYIEFQVFNYSVNNFKHPLCRKCQVWFKDMTFQTTQETMDLYLALKQRGVPAELEKFDGYKTIDIAVTDAKVNIEVDGHQHKLNAFQALSDLQRTYYSFREGYVTLRIPNSLVHFKLDETADLIKGILIENRERIYFG